MEFQANLVKARARIRVLEDKVQGVYSLREQRKQNAKTIKMHEDNLSKAQQQRDNDKLTIKEQQRNIERLTGEKRQFERSKVSHCPHKFCVPCIQSRTSAVLSKLILTNNILQNCQKPTNTQTGQLDTLHTTLEKLSIQIDTTEGQLGQKQSECNLLNEQLERLSLQQGQAAAAPFTCEYHGASSDGPVEPVAIAQTAVVERASIAVSDAQHKLQQERSKHHHLLEQHAGIQVAYAQRTAECEALTRKLEHATRSNEDHVMHQSVYIEKIAKLETVDAARRSKSDAGLEKSAEKERQIKKERRILNEHVQNVRAEIQAVKQQLREQESENATLQRDLGDARARQQQQEEQREHAEQQLVGGGTDLQEILVELKRCADVIAQYAGEEVELVRELFGGAGAAEGGAAGRRRLGPVTAARGLVNLTEMLESMASFKSFTQYCECPVLPLHVAVQAACRQLLCNTP